MDLVIWNEDRAVYRQVLQDQIMGLIAAGLEAGVPDRPGGIFVRFAEQISNEDRILLQTVARVVISDNWGLLSDQITRRGLAKTIDRASNRPGPLALNPPPSCQCPAAI